MIEAFILIVVLDAYSGLNVSMQEFNSLDQCNKAKEVILSAEYMNSYVKKIECITK